MYYQSINHEKQMGDRNERNEKDGQITLHYPLLTRNNYATWAIKMKVFMQAQGVWEAVVPRTANTVVEVKKDKMALAAIYQGIPEDLLLSLAEKQTAREAWEALKTMFMGANRVRTAKIQTLKAEFEGLSMRDSEAVDEFAVKVSNIVSNIRALGDTIEESYVVKKLLRAVPSKFLQIASTLEQFGDLDSMTVEEVIGRLKAHEERMRGHCENEDKKLLLTHQEWTERNKKKTDESNKSSYRGNRGGFNPSRGRGRGRGGGGPTNGRGGRGGRGFHQQKESNGDTSKNWDKSKIQCYHCQEYGHYAAECVNPRRERNQESNLTQEQGNDEPTLLMSTIDSNEEILEVFLNEENVNPKLKTSGNEEIQTRMWYLDTRASNHMTGDKTKFRELNQMIQGAVRFGNGSKVRIQGRGSIAFKCKNGKQRMLKEVYYIPDLCSNIISLGQLAEGGDEIQIKDPFLWVYDVAGKLLMKVQRSQNRLYKILLNEVSPECLLGETCESTWLWHARMGHVNFDTLKSMSDKKLVGGMPKISKPTQVCEGCLVGKQTRRPYPLQSNYRAKMRLEIVHGDLCGPITPPTPSGNQYFMLLVDDYTRAMWVYLMKTKDEAFQVFKNFRAAVENETGERIKVFRTDRGGEFLSNQFTKYCKETGLERHYTAPYSPQQNGVVERRNRTVVEMARSNLKGMKMPNVLWGEAVSHAVYILNRVSTKSLEETTPYELWTGRKPQIGHLRVFGCVAHMMIPKNHLKKLDDRSKRVVHLGIEKGTKAYRLLDPVTGSIYVSRNVVFEEEKVWPCEETVKIKEIPGMSFTIEGYDVSDTEEIEVGPMSGISDETESGPQPTYVQMNSPTSPPGSPNYSSQSNLPTPITPVLSIGSSSTGSSSTGDGAPKRYHMLTDLYEQTDELLLIENSDEPSSYREACKKIEWVNAMKTEFVSIEKNKTWNLVELPKGRKAIGLKWVFKVKKDPSGRIVKHKARLVARGYVQKPGIDYEDVFAPVARLETVRIILALAGSNDWLVHHLDVKSAFLNGKLDEEVYVLQPEGFEKRGQMNRVYKLTKALYGLKQAPRAWNACLDKYLKSLDLVRCTQEYSVYTRSKNGKILIVAVYVDDLLVTGNCIVEVKIFKEQMNKKFEMNDLGLLTYYLGIEVGQLEGGITLKQEAYARNILDKTEMSQCNSTKCPIEHKVQLTKDEDGDLVDPTEYRRIVGSLRYLTHTRPDLSFAVGVVSRFMEKPTTKHLQAVKGILRYVKGTVDYGLVYLKGKNEVKICGYSDSDLAMDVNDRRSTSGMAFYINESLVTWTSQKQHCVALSSCEAEFMAATMATCQAIWIRRLLAEITGHAVEPAILHVDNKSALDLMKNPVFHGRSKHIDTRFHFIRECVENGEVTVVFVSSKEQRADILTKSMAKMKHKEMRELIGVKQITNSGLGGECYYNPDI